MAPTKSSKASASQSKTDLSQGEADSAGASQEADNQYWGDFMRHRQRRTAERRAQRKQKILAEHNERMGKVNIRIKERIEKYNAQARARRRSGVECLIELARRKCKLENKMEACKAELEGAFSASAMQLRLALEGRVNELST